MYNPKEIEDKWSKTWQKDLYFAKDSDTKPKKFILVEFPYPSGAGLHMGHLRSYVAADVVSRYNRARGYNVMFPIGWDAFGLPAENYAIKMGVKPDVSTAQNIANFKKQLDALGLSFDWSREVNTTDPNYYKWTQWIFLQLYKAGLAYEATGLINWCPKDKTGLANEEVIDGKCERCGSIVEKKELRQWYLKITEYAEKLLDGLKDLDWPERVKVQQENWIGKSEGAIIKFEVPDSKVTEVEVFTTRPDTIFGATFVVISPEMAKKWIEDGWGAANEVRNYVASSLTQEEIDRVAEGKEKTGVDTGLFAINPATEQKIPIWVADYVLGAYGTGAIMAVPAHDERDFEFAKKFNLPVVKVIDNSEELYSGDGKLINSGEYNEEFSDVVRLEMAKKFGIPKVQYKLRDWVFSRQRYWGEPIPLIHCAKCGIVPVPDDQLPVILPDVEQYEPTGTGESPLAAIDAWVNVKCPKCEGDAKRETNTMPQWAGSSWYWIRYTDPKNETELAAKNNQKYWTPVDMYFGGMEHTTLHLLYARFWNRFLYDQKIATAPEPFAKRIPHGIVLASDGEKMSKSRGNVVNPDELISQYGADTTRMYEMFLGPHESQVAWNEQGVVGVKRFLDRVYKLSESPGGEDSRLIHKLIKKISNDVESYKFNTAVAAFMEFLNSVKAISKTDWEKFLIVLAPFAPFLAEELWQKSGHSDSVHVQDWPEYDEKLALDDQVTVAIQIMGKLRGTLQVPAGASEADLVNMAKADESIGKHLAGKEIVKQIFVPDKLINFVVKQ